MVPRPLDALISTTTDMDESSREVIQRLEMPLFWGAVVLVFVSFQMNSYPVLLLLWCWAFGVVGALVLFRIIPQLPNLLLHLKIPKRKPPVRWRPLSLVPCAVCGQKGCKRHEHTNRNETLQPWDDLIVAETVDNALSEFLEIVLQRFVHSWHRRLVPDEAFEEELRVAIRHTAAAFLRRARKVDIPSLITGKLLRAAAAHMHIYLLARRKLPRSVDVEAIQEAVMQEYGCRTHVAMRGMTANLCYFRRLTLAVLPHLLPERALQSQVMKSFIVELFASKIFVPAMNFAAKPDFINKVLSLICDPNSRLKATYGPLSRQVKLLASFVRQSGSARPPRPLSLPLDKLLTSQDSLYTFMQFMKSQDAVHILQVHLALSELKCKLQSASETQAQSVIIEVSSLYSLYFNPSVRSHIPLEPGLRKQLDEVLSSDESAAEKCELMHQQQIISRVLCEVYQLLEETYLPLFYQSHEFYTKHIGKRGAGTEGGKEGGKKIQRWRSKTRTVPSMDSITPREHPAAELSDSEASGRDSPAIAEAAPPPPVPTPYKVQVVGWESNTDGIRPFTVYIILTRREGEGVDSKLPVEKVKRRFKEFVVLDSRLRQFYGDIRAQLPLKRPLRNMDKSFVEARSKELQQYLEKLITVPGVQSSQLLASFLTDTSDPALFLPDSVSDKAGKMFKSVPSMLKREKGQHMEEFLQTLVEKAEFPARQSNPQTVAELTAAVETNKENVERYLQDVEEDHSESETNRAKPWLKQVSLGEPLELNGVMDLLVYMALNVYHVSQWQLTVLLVAKLLGKSTLETFLYNFIAHKVSLMEDETNAVELIHLLRDNLFFNKDPPRTQDEVYARRQAALGRLLCYPPGLLVRGMGEETFRDGTMLIFEGLQCHLLNKQLFFTLLDIIVLELFPELDRELDPEQTSPSGGAHM